MEWQNSETYKVLKERIKKQSALISEISNLDEKKLSEDDFFQKVLNLVLHGWTCPKEISIEIIYDFNRYQTDKFKKTEWEISAETGVRKISTISLSLYFRDGKEFKQNHHFVEDESVLLSSLVSIIATKLENIISRDQILERQNLLDKAYKLARIGTWEYDMVNDILTWSDITKEVHGFESDYEPDVESTIQLFKEGYDRKTFELAAHNAIENEQPFDVELKIISGKGDERWIRATGEPEYKNGVCTRFYGISQNVTDRKQAEENLYLNEKRFKALVQDGSDMLAILDEQVNYMYVSPASEKVLGIPPEKLIGKNASEFIHGEDWERAFEDLINLKSKQSVEIKPYRFANSDGEWRWISTKLTNLSDDPAVQGYVANSRDITDKKMKDELILSSLKEKETLLAEIHHRVKNNLAVITGLLQLHIEEEDNEESLNRLYDSVSRIYTIGNIHEQLYQSNSFSKLEFTDNIRKLTSNISDTFKSDKEIEVNFKCDEVFLNINQALPCSLIVNEVLTNILKHAFAGRKHGKIYVGLSVKESSLAQLVINDDGIGLPDDFDVKNKSSLGLTLIDVLSNQLEAEYNYQSSETGTTFTMQFAIN